MYRDLRDQKFAYIVDMEFLDIAALEDPGLCAAMEYWDQIRGGRVGPPVDRFRLERLPPEVIRCTAVLDLIDGEPPDFRYRFFGSYMVEVAGQELTGKRYFADEVKGFGFVNAEIIPVLIERRAPIYSRTRWVSVKGMRMSATTLRLPLSEDGERVTGVFVADRFRQGHD